MSFLYFAVVLFICCYDILDLVYILVYCWQGTVSKTKAYWGEYWANDLAKYWFLCTEKKNNLLQVHWLNALLCWVFLLSYLNMSRFNCSKNVGFGTFDMVPKQHAMTYWLFASFFLFNPLPYAFELIVGYQFLSETALKMFLILYIMFLILYIKLGHYKG